MARKRKKLKTLDYTSREYWNRLLSEDGLTMSQGLDPRLVYDDDIEARDSRQQRSGRKLPYRPSE
jgi:hypothetical protein